MTTESWAQLYITYISTYRWSIAKLHQRGTFYFTWSICCKLLSWLEFFLIDVQYWQCAFLKLTRTKRSVLGCTMTPLWCGTWPGKWSWNWCRHSVGHYPVQFLATKFRTEWTLATSSSTTADRASWFCGCVIIQISNFWHAQSRSAICTAVCRSAIYCGTMNHMVCF